MVVCPVSSTAGAVAFLRPVVSARASTGLFRSSVVMVDKISAIPQERLVERIGAVHPSLLIRVRLGLQALLAI